MDNFYLILRIIKLIKKIFNPVQRITAFRIQRNNIFIYRLFRLRKCLHLPFLKLSITLMIAQQIKAPVVLATKSRHVSWLSKLNGPRPRNSSEYSISSFNTPSAEVQANSKTNVRRQGNFRPKVF